MQSAAKMLTYAAVVLLCGCLLAPPLYWGARALVDAGVAPFLAKFQFPKYLNRAILLSALALAWPFLRWMGVRGPRDLGLEKNPRYWRHLGLGVGLAMAGLLIVGTLMLWVGRARFVHHPRWLDVGGDFVTGVTVAVIEETFFRGALLGVLLRTWSWRPALGFLSTFFAALHFIKPPKKLPKLASVEWTSAFELLPKMFWQFGSTRLVLGGLITLVLVGLVLGYTVIKTRSLALAIGLHAGWVFALRGFDTLTKLKGKSTMWFGGNLMTGLAPVALVGVTFVVVILLLNRRAPVPTAAAPVEAAS